MFPVILGADRQHVLIEDQKCWKNKAGVNIVTEYGEMFATWCDT